MHAKTAATSHPSQAIASPNISDGGERYN